MKKIEKNNSETVLRRRYQKLADKLAETGLILQGTITERSIERPDPADPIKSKIYGPYYQWMWKKEGKTVTVNLTKSQAKIYMKAISNNRELGNIIQKMRDASLKICEITTTGVKKRKAK